MPTCYIAYNQLRVVKVKRFKEIRVVNILHLYRVLDTAPHTTATPHTINITLHWWRIQPDRWKEDNVVSNSRHAWTVKRLVASINTKSIDNCELLGGCTQA